MSYPTDAQFEEARQRRQPPGLMVSPAKKDTLVVISTEVARMRHIAPRPVNLMNALTQQLVDLQRVTIHGRTTPEIQEEAIRLAALAVRIIEEGHGGT